MPVYTAWLMRIAESSCKTQATPRLVGELKASGKRSRIWYWRQKIPTQAAMVGYCT